ncbi:hypothetical protein [Pseudomonas sp. PS02302]|uniref:hypothetical protein n=1 Tax=Pseudomonas sp. PS02302 TaxID=2991428 RepID=UPI00249BD45A|nr:hypothetical protein [Pseudomonas sp. PS02302]
MTDTPFKVEVRHTVGGTSKTFEIESLFPSSLPQVDTSDDRRLREIIDAIEEKENVWITLDGKTFYNGIPVDNITPIIIEATPKDFHNWEPLSGSWGYVPKDTPSNIRVIGDK